MSRLAYVMSRYPAVSHAFLLREIQALRDAGVAVETVSIHRAIDTVLLSDADRAEADRTFNVLPVGVRTLLAAHVMTFGLAPRRYLATLALALRLGSATPRERLWHLFYFAEAMVLACQVRRARISHLHAQFADVATDVSMLVSNYFRGQVTWSLAVHGSVEFYNVISYALAQKLAHARFAIAISDFGRSQLMTLSDPDRWAHIHVVRCGVDLDRYVSRAPREPNSAKAEILYVGRLLRGKGVSLLLESVANLVAEGLDITLTVVGDGEDRDRLEQDIQRLSLNDRIQLVGSVGQDDLARLYQDADLFCLPSFAEGIPVVVMEAMATELPVVTTRIMGIPELIADGVDGILVSPGRVDELTAALRDLVRSPELRTRLGTAARTKVAARYDIRTCALEMRRVLERETDLATAEARRS